MIVLLIFVAALAFYYFSTKNYNYWAARNVKHERPIPIFGTHFRNLLGYKSATQVFTDLYKKYPEDKVIGYYRGRTPELLIRDPDLVKLILNGDFNHFYIRGIGRNIEMEPLHLNLFHLEGDKWKLLRQRLTSAFTTSKLKGMFPLIVRCAEKLQIVAGEFVEKPECNVKDLTARFFMEVIGACGFGIDTDTINNDHSKFKKLGQLIFLKDFKVALILALFDLFPELKKYLRAISTEINDSILSIFKNIQKQRNDEPIGRNDFVDLLLELKKDSEIVGDSIEKKNEDGKAEKVKMKLDDKTLVAQFFVFFAAGFETSSFTTSFTLHQLAYNPAIQKNVQEEIDTVISKYNNKLCYDAITEMSLLNMAFKESMRIFPTLGVLRRVCVKKYKIPSLNITIDPGVIMTIPVHALQNDDQYFDKPEEFRPERFSAEAVKKRHKYVYLPFGEGPRICIGARLGLMQSLACLASLLHKFTFEPSPSSTPTIPVNPLSNITQAVIGGILLRIKKRK